ncbi:integrase, catalytic region, zinc finger, CCHC-type containing protein [Tanacetum coccineum]
MQVVQVILWYMDSGCSKHMTGNRSKLKNFMEKFIGTVRFGNDHFGAIMDYGDYVIGDSVISRVYYVEGLGHNLFSVGQFCNSDLEVAFRKHSCFVRDINGEDLLKGSRSTNLYTISIDDMMKSSPICLLSKASKSKSWLGHRRLKHLNFGTINDLARKDLVRGLPRLKFDKIIFAQLSTWKKQGSVGIFPQKSVLRNNSNKIAWSKDEIVHLWKQQFNADILSKDDVSMGRSSHHSTIASSSKSDMHIQSDIKALQERTLSRLPITHDALHPSFTVTGETGIGHSLHLGICTVKPSEYSIECHTRICSSTKWMSKCFLTGDLQEEVLSVSLKILKTRDNYSRYRLKRSFWAKAGTKSRGMNHYQSSFGPIFSRVPWIPTLFTRKSSKHILLVQIYVDDIIFASTVHNACHIFSKEMSFKFQMSMMGQMLFFLGLQVSQSPRGIFINQAKYALETLKKYGMDLSDPVDTPMVDRLKLDEDLMGILVDQTRFRGMVGSTNGPYSQ